MISKEERERDKAICDAAGPFEVEDHGHEEWWIYDSPGSYAARVGEVDTPQMAAFIAAARARLPLYIAALDEVERERAAVADDVLTLLDAYERGYDIPNDSALRDRLRAFVAGGEK